MSGGEQNLFTTILQFGAFGLCVWMVMQNYKNKREDDKARAERDTQFLAYVQNTEKRMTEMNTWSVKVIANVAAVLKNVRCVANAEALENLDKKESNDAEDDSK